MATTPLHLPNNFLAVPSSLVVPPGYLSRSSSANEIEHAIGNYSHFAAGGFSFGTRLYRDPDTLVIRWAPKGSGIDDKLLAAIADGEIANVGIAPVMFDQLSALIKRRQEQVNSASVVVTGRTTPATRALNALARMNDSPTGVIAGMRRILYGLDVFNRGAPIATVPITYPVDQWSQHGMTLRPILDAAGQESDKFYLEVDWRGRSPVPYLPNVFDLEPTGNSQWPYWYRVTLDGVKRWVLLHQSQIITLLSAETNRPGIGTSPVWICLPVMAENTLVIDERYARLIDRPTQGILTISGVTQSAETIRTKLDEPDQSWTLLAAPNPITVDGYSFRQPDDIDPVKRQGHFEDVLAAAFNEHLSAVVIRGGIGYGVQGEAAADNVAENGVFAILQAIEIAFGTIYPSVSITVTKANDRARRLALELLGLFADAVDKLPADTFTPAELRAIIDCDHLTIPATTNVAQADARPGTAAENDTQLESHTAIVAAEVEIATLLADCRTFLHHLLSATPAAQLHQALAAARTVHQTIRPNHHIAHLLHLTRHLHAEIHAPLIHNSQFSIHNSQFAPLFSKFLHSPPPPSPAIILVNGALRPLCERQSEIYTLSLSPQSSVLSLQSSVGNTLTNHNNCPLKTKN